MEFQTALIATLLGVVLVGTFSHSEPAKKISTSLIVVDAHQNQSAAARPPEFSVTITSSKISGEASASADNRENATRLLTATGSSLEKMSVDEETLEDDEAPEVLPEAQELRHAGARRRLHQRRPTTLNRRNVFQVEPLRSSKRPTRKPTNGKREPTEKDCTFFSKTVCLKTLNYPQEAILRSIRLNKEMTMALLKDFNAQLADKEDSHDTELYQRRYDRFENNEIKRRSDYSSYDNVEEGFTCPSSVIYARPQLARAASGLWKYIINTGEHTQTLRLEKCSNPSTSCSFISENYRSSCVQVYNYHRLLTWDSNLGLHMDIFKIPSCCSCHVHGYAELFPPISKDPPISVDEAFPGAEFSTDESDDGIYDRPSSYFTKHKQSTVLDNNFVGSPSKPIADAGTQNRPKFLLPSRPRPKKPSTSPKTVRLPFDKLPQQHAPNTRAPGYKGPVHQTNSRPRRPNRPFRRDSSADIDDSASSSSSNSWFSQPYDLDSDNTGKAHAGDFDDDYQEPNRRVNYNYHPIIDFFKPEASMLQSADTVSTQSSAISPSDDGNSWKPLIST